VPAEATVCGTRIVVCVSKFGSLALVCAENPGAFFGTEDAQAEGGLDAADLAKVNRALAHLGYAVVPEELLNATTMGRADCPGTFSGPVGGIASSEASDDYTLKDQVVAGEAAVDHVRPVLELFEPVLDCAGDLAEVGGGQVADVAFDQRPDPLGRARRWVAGLLPHATVKDLGIRCIYGRMAITETTGALIPEVINRGFSWVSDDTGCGAGFAPVRFRFRLEGASDYLMITLLATPERLGMPDEGLFKLPPETLRKITTSFGISRNSAMARRCAAAYSGVWSRPGIGACWKTRSCDVPS
jgi:hypothetical protein